MFSPRELELERGWPGRIEGGHVIQLAAQTLQAFFTGGGRARAHAEYALAEVSLRAPVLHPPSVRLFDAEDSFEFANPAAIHGPGATVAAPGELEVYARACAVIGADQAIGGLTLMADFRAPGLPPPKDRDFAMGLGPVLITPDEAPRCAFDWENAIAFAARHTRLHPGDLLAAPAHGTSSPAEMVELELDGTGVLRLSIGL